MNNQSLVKKTLPTSAYRAKGFTFIELVIVIILLGLLAAAAIPRLLDVTDEAEIASLEGVAGGFSTAAAIAHAQWAAVGNSAGGATTPADKVSINMDGQIIYMNEFGWPANTSATTDSSADSQSAQECQQVINAVLQNAPTTTTDQNNRASIRYFVSAINQAGSNGIGDTGDVCRFEQILNNSASATATHYFDYDLVDGQVVTVTPNIN